MPMNSPVLDGSGALENAAQINPYVVDDVAFGETVMRKRIEFLERRRDGPRNAGIIKSCSRQCSFGCQHPHRSLAHRADGDAGIDTGFTIRGDA